MVNKYLLSIICVSLISFSCSKWYSDEGVPSYIHIDKIDLDAGIGQGTDSSKIVDAWVYLGQEYVGTYELPATFPVLATGEQELLVKPGIMVNGIAASRTINPFMKSITKTIVLREDSVINLSFTTQYDSQTKFPWNAVGQEDFDQVGLSLDSVTGSTVEIVKSKDDVYEGDFSGKISLDATHDYYYGQSETKFEIPTNKTGTLLELNCKNTSSILIVGINFELSGGTIQNEPYLYVNPTADWKKLYVNFTELINNYSTATNFQIFFKVTKSSSVSQEDVFLDNIKLVHF